MMCTLVHKYFVSLQTTIYICPHLAANTATYLSLFSIHFQTRLRKSLFLLNDSYLVNSSHATYTPSLSPYNVLLLYYYLLQRSMPSLHFVYNIVTLFINAMEYSV